MCQSWDQLCSDVWGFSEITGKSHICSGTHSSLSSISDSEKWGSLVGFFPKLRGSRSALHLGLYRICFSYFLNFCFWYNWLIYSFSFPKKASKSSKGIITCQQNMNIFQVSWVVKTVSYLHVLKQVRTTNIKKITEICRKMWYSLTLNIIRHAN